MPNKKQIKIFDTTLRDGEQAPGYSMNLEQKIRMARQLEKLGVDVIEAGFPIASPEDFESVKEIAKACKTAEVCGLARASKKDIQTCWDAIKNAKKPRIHTFLSTSPVHMKHKLKKEPEEVLQMAIDAVKFAKSLCDRVDFSPEDATRTEPEFLYKVIEEVIKAGADTINIPDTVGYTTPNEFGELIKGIKENVPNINEVIIATHCHNDLGLAVANSIAGIENGARQIECTINGIGERAGNAALEEIIMTLRTRKDIYDFKTNIKTKELYPTSKLLTMITGVSVQPNKAIVGANAFAHESGIHQDGYLKNRETYEIMTPESVGVKQSKLVLGKHSGRHALKSRLEELDYQLNEKDLDKLFVKFKELADKKKEIFNEDLYLLLTDETSFEPAYKFKELFVICGNKQDPEAELVLIKNGIEKTAKNKGDGPVDAAYGAVKKIVNLPNRLLEYSVNSVTEGIDAQATVSVRIKIKDKTYSGSSSDTDIVVASVKAYLDALNRAIHLTKRK